MANEAIASNTTTERVVKLEVNDKLQNLFSRFALGAVLVLAVAYVAFSAVIYTQLSDLDIGQSELRTDVSGLKSDVSSLKTNQNTILERLKSLPE